MSRRTSAPKRTILPDPKYSSDLLAKFTNMIMCSGKKSVAEGIIYGALDRIVERSGQDEQKAVELFGKALDNVKPMVEVKSRRVGGATYQVPSKFARHAARRLPCAGLSMQRVYARRSPWRIAWRMRFSMPSTIVVQP